MDFKIPGSLNDNVKSHSHTFGISSTHTPKGERDTIK